MAGVSSFPNKFSTQTMNEIRLQIHTRHLKRTWLFYTCLGMVWDEGSGEEPRSEKPTFDVLDSAVAELVGGYCIPEYSGALEGMKFDFFYSETSEYTHPNTSGFLSVHYESQEEVKTIAERLKEAGFRPASGLKSGWSGEQKDPDGRLVHVTGPSIGEVFKAYFR